MIHLIHPCPVCISISVFCVLGYKIIKKKVKKSDKKFGGTK